MRGDQQFTHRPFSPKAFSVVSSGLEMTPRVNLEPSGLELGSSEPVWDGNKMLNNLKISYSGQWSDHKQIYASACTYNQFDQKNVVKQTLDYF